MSRIRTFTTTSVSYPTCVGWKCSKCGTLNYGEGKLVVSDSTTTFLGRVWPRELQHNKDDEWKREAIDIIVDPLKNATKLRDSIVLNNYKCRKCKNREIWSRKKWYGGLGIIAFFVLIFCYLIATGEKTFAPWLPMIFVSAFIIYCIFLDVLFDYLMPELLKKLPKESLPSIACVDKELQEYAKSINRPIFSPELFGPTIYAASQEAKEKNINKGKIILTQQDKGIDEDKEEYQSKTAEYSELDSEKNKTDNYCYKCGNKLKEGSDFCSYCGAELRENKT